MPPNLIIFGIHNLQTFYINELLLMQLLPLIFVQLHHHLTDTKLSGYPDTNRASFPVY